MFITTLFMLFLFASFIEGNDENIALTDHMDVNLEQEILREIIELQQKLGEQRHLRIQQEQMQLEQMAEMFRTIEQLQAEDELSLDDMTKRSMPVFDIPIWPSTPVPTTQAPTPVPTTPVPTTPVPTTPVPTTPVPTTPVPTLPPVQPKSRYTAMGCLGSDIVLSCSADRTISLTSARLGHFQISCSADCCPPNPHQDCTADIAEVDPDLWMYLELMCKDEGECGYQYTGQTVDGCASGHLADYMQIDYDCLPGPLDEPVGFTIHTTITREYRTNETIVFDNVQNNFGSYVSQQTSSFHCPHSGIYFFGVNFNADKGQFMYVELVRDNTVLSDSMAYGQHDVPVYNSGGSLVVVECRAGQSVWARSSGPEQSSLYSLEKGSQFSGYLLHRY